MHTITRMSTNSCGISYKSEIIAVIIEDDYVTRSSTVESQARLHSSRTSHTKIAIHRRSDLLIANSNADPDLGAVILAT